MDAALARDLLDYDPLTGAFTWRVKTSSRGLAGTRAGCQRKDGYRLIGFAGRMYLEHRIAMLMVNGVWPAVFVDHINGDPSDNRLANLRLATHSENHCNRGRQQNNTSGYKGVIWLKREKRWRAQIKRHGATTYLGFFSSAEDAHEAYRQAAPRVHGDFGRSA